MQEPTSPWLLYRLGSTGTLVLLNFGIKLIQIGSLFLVKEVGQCNSYLNSRVKILLCEFCIIKQTAWQLIACGIFLLWLTDKSIGHFICLAFQEILTWYFRLYSKFWLSLLAFLGLCQFHFSHAGKNIKSNYYPLIFYKRIASLSLYRRGPVLVCCPQRQMKLSGFKMHFKR